MVATNNKQNTVNFQPKVINLSQTRLTKQQIQTLSFGPNYAIEKEPKYYINDLKKATIQPLHDAAR